jgi:hypothetical protein
MTKLLVFMSINSCVSYVHLNIPQLFNVNLMWLQFKGGGSYLMNEIWMNFHEWKKISNSIFWMIFYFILKFHKILSIKVHPVKFMNWYRIDVHP